MNKIKTTVVTVIITLVFCCAIFNTKSSYADDKELPLVSVIMPIWNSEKFINQAVDSVINQTYKNLEIILVDDCSTDGTYRILEDYAKKDNRIKLIRNEKNLQNAETRNVGIRVATGKYLYFIDSDDWIDSDYIENMVDAAEKSGADMVMNFGVYHYYNKFNKKPAFDFVKNKELDDRNYLFTMINGTVWNKLYRTDVQKAHNIYFNDKYIIINDTIFSLKFMANSQKIIGINKKSFYYWRYRKGSVSYILLKKKNYDEFIEAQYELSNYLKNNNLENSGRLVNLCFYEILLLKKPENYEKIRKLFIDIKEQVYNHAEFYNIEEINFLNLFLNSETYEQYKNKYYFCYLMIRFIIIIFITIILITIKVFYDLIKHFKGKLYQKRN